MMQEHKFTVIWGRIADTTENRLDHVTVTLPEGQKPTFKDVMDEAFELVHIEWELSEDFEDFRHNTAYDGYALFEGHLAEGTINFIL